MGNSQPEIAGSTIGTAGTQRTKCLAPGHMAKHETETEKNSKETHN